MSGETAATGSVYTKRQAAAGNICFVCCLLRGLRLALFLSLTHANNIRASRQTTQQVHTLSPSILEPSPRRLASRVDSSAWATDVVLARAPGYCLLLLCCCVNVRSYGRGMYVRAERESRFHSHCGVPRASTSSSPPRTNTRPSQIRARTADGGR